MPRTRSRDDAGREQFGQRRGDGFEQRLVAHEVDIGIDREARAGKEARESTSHSRGRARARRSSLSQRAMPPSPSRVAVMVDDARGAIRGAAPDRRSARSGVRVLDRDHRLVIVAVERPGLHLRLRELAAMQQVMERMKVVVARRADGAQRRLQFARLHEFHSAISMLSYATSKPASSTRRRSDEPSSRTGLVLLMWMKMRRAESPRAPQASRPARR